MRDIYHQFTHMEERPSRRIASVTVTHCVYRISGGATKIKVPIAPLRHRRADLTMEQIRLDPGILETTKQRLAHELLDHYMAKPVRRPARKPISKTRFQSPKEEPGDSCEVCWDTGFVQGFGAPCPKGCKKL